MPKGKRPAENSVKVNCKTKTSTDLTLRSHLSAGLLRTLVAIELCKVNHKGYKELT